MSAVDLGWSMGETYAAIGIPLVLGFGIVAAWLARFVSTKWSDRIAQFVTLTLLGLVIMSLLLWSTPWPAAAS